MADGRIVIEAVLQLLVDTLVHPIFRLFVATILEVAVGFDVVDVADNHLQHLVDAQIVETAVTKHLGHQAAIGHREQVEGIPEVRSRQLGTVHIVAVGLVDHDAVGNLHDTSLDALQFVARTSQLNEQEEIDHRVACRLALTHTHGLHKHMVVACRFAQDDGLASLASHTTQAACRGRRTNKRLRVHGQFFHTGLIAQDTAFRLLATRVDSQHRQFSAVVVQQVNPKRINTRTLACTRHTADAHTYGVSAVRKAFFNHLLCHDLMLGQRTFDQRHRLTQSRHVTLQDAADIFIDGKQHLPVLTHSAQVGIDRRRLGHARIYLQTGILVVVFRVFHLRNTILRCTHY